MNLLRLNQWRTLAEKSLTYLIVLSVGLNLVGCSTPDIPEPLPPSQKAPEHTQSIVEVSPPIAVQKLHRTLDQYQPQIKIVSPPADKVLQDNTVTLELDVQNFPIFQQDTLGLGPYLQVILDDQPQKAIYNLDQPLTFEDLKPGTHTIRVFAAYPWGETYKNQEAYDQTVFHLFTRTPSNTPDLNQPLLTLNQPTGVYGTEPILLDFYLANLPVKPINSEEFVEDTVDWQVEMTLNGERFLIDQWQPIYIEGVKTGQNWIQLQYLDGQGQPFNNVYNNTGNVFTYDPEVSNSLSQLFKGEFSADMLQAIVDPDFVYEVPTPVAETEELDENPVEPAVSEEPEPLLEEPAEETLEEAEEANLTEATEAEEAIPDDTAAAIKESINETIEELETLKELIIEESNLESVETAIDETVEELEQEDNTDDLEAVLEDNLTEAIEQTEILEESVLLEDNIEEAEATVEEIDTLEKENIEETEAAIEQTETLEESIAEADNFENTEAAIEETETLEESIAEADNFENTEAAIEETETSEEFIAEENNLSSIEGFDEATVNEEELTETVEFEEDNTNVIDERLEDTVDNTVIQIDETSEIPIVTEELSTEEVTVKEEDLTTIPEEVVAIYQTSDIISEENTNISQVEQPKSERLFSAIVKQIKGFFFDSNVTETTEPPEIKSVTIPDEGENAELMKTEKVEIKTWFNSVLKRVKLPFTQS
ncbi:MAG: hypothetical protein WBA77_19445 [Microcoleaceae cyanobacterium]